MTRENGGADHVARYCSKMRIDADEIPLPVVFELCQMRSGC